MKKTAKSILISCGARLAPFDITRHPNYKMLEDFDKRNVFDIEDYLKRSGRVKLSANTVVRRFSQAMNSQDAKIEAINGGINVLDLLPLSPVLWSKNLTTK